MINTKTPLHILIHKDQYPRRQLNALYKAIPITEEQISLLRKYFDAFANLYGIVPLSIAYDIIHKQAPELVTKEQFLAFSEIARHECEEYRILGAEDVFQGVQATPAMDREIVDIALLETDFDEYFHLHEKQFGSPFCIPPQNILLRYSDPFYTEADSAFKKIRKMLRSLLSNTDNSEEMISVLCSEIIFGARYMDADIVEIMERLEYHQVIFTSDDSAMEFAKLYSNFYADARAQWRRGFPLYEQLEEKPFTHPYTLSAAFGPIVRYAIAKGYVEAYDYQKILVTMDMPNEDVRYQLLKALRDMNSSAYIESDTPISRNSPCPCGSGKRYKHCCGKTK